MSSRTSGGLLVRPPNPAEVWVSCCSLWPTGGVRGTEELSSRLLYACNVALRDLPLPKRTLDLVDIDCLPARTPAARVFLVPWPHAPIVFELFIRKRIEDRTFAVDNDDDVVASLLSRCRGGGVADTWSWRSA